MKNNDVIELIDKIYLFINNISSLADNYDLDENSVNNIYELLFSNTMELIFQKNLKKLKLLFNYHYDIFNQIVKSITYEDICKIIKKYLIEAIDWLKKLKKIYN